MLVFCVAAFVAGLYFICKIKHDSQDEDSFENSFEDSFADSFEEPTKNFFEEPTKSGFGLGDLQSRVNEMSDSQIVQFIRNKILPVNPRAVQAVHFVPGTFSETLNKNIIRICVRNKKSKKVYPVNTLVHVALHELAHTIMDEYDPNHSEKFFNTLDPLVNRAIVLGIYDAREETAVDYMESCARKR